VDRGASGCDRFGPLRDGQELHYYPASKLFGQLKLSRADGSYLKELSRIQKQALIILDDFGLQVLDPPSRLSLLEILEDRYGRASSIVVSQLPVSSWHEMIGDPTIADAICDRIVHGAHRIELNGESVRKLYTQRKAEQKGRLV
jgi:DNA replication protein DnaC